MWGLTPSSGDHGLHLVPKYWPRSVMLTPAWFSAQGFGCVLAWLPGVSEVPFKGPPSCPPAIPHCIVSVLG